MTEPVLVCSGLRRAYAGRSVLEGVDLRVRAGEVLGLIGPNGGGKSTLLLLMAGLVRPTSGTVSVGGMPAAEVALRQTGTIGLITADAGVYPLLTGRENLRFFGGLYALTPSDVDTRSAPFLERLGLDADIDRRVGEWSSGMRQKLSLARALLMQPRLLLLDEPTANLDPLASHTIHAAVRDQADAGVAVVMATHDLPAAEGICDEVLLVRERVLARETFTGERRILPTGRLHALYATTVGAPSARAATGERR